MALNVFLVKIAGFDIINTGDWVDPSVFYLPEADPFSSGMDQSGYGSTILISNMSFIVWMYILNFTILIFVYGPIWVINRNCSGRLAEQKANLSKYYFWNGLIRLLMETYFEIVLSAAINIDMVNWDTQFPAV